MTVLVFGTTSFRLSNDLISSAFEQLSVITTGVFCLMFYEYFGGLGNLTAESTVLNEPSLITGLLGFLSILIN